ncbi:MAG: transcriptional regulator [Anaerobutyricum soehngenii]
MGNEAAGEPDSEVGRRGCGILGGGERFRMEELSRTEWGEMCGSVKRFEATGKISLLSLTESPGDGVGSGSIELRELFTQVP